MPTFDPNKYKQLFDQQFGAGAFDKGMQQARQIGTLQTQANLAQKDITSRLNKLRTTQMSNKKSYQDAVNYFNSNPDELNNIRQQGAYGAVNAIKNDPAKQQAIKDAGYNLNDYYNAMYNAASGGKFKSQREYNQFSSQLNKDTKAQNKAFQDANGGLTQDQVYQMNQQNPPPTSSSNKPSLLSGLLDKLKNSEVGRATTAAEQFFNPFDNVSAKDAVNNYLNHKQSNTFQEVARGANRAADSASLGLMSNLDKKVNNRTPYYNSARPIGQGGGTDMITSALGYLVPGVGIEKGIGALGIGTKEASGLAKLGQIAGKGALAGGTLTGAQTGINYALNPKDQNLKDNLENIGLGIGLGAVGDPLLHGAGKLIGKAFGKGIEANPTQAHELLGLPAPQLRLNEPQLQLPAPKGVEPTMDTVMNFGKMPNGLQNPIPEMPSILKNELQTQKLKNAGLGFGYNSSLEPKARMPIAPTSLPKFAQEGIVQKGDNLLNTVSQMDGKPSNYFTNRLLQVQKEMKSINDKRANYRPSLSVDELYNRVKTPNDPATFDELVKMNQLEANASKNAPVQGPRQGNLKDALNTDPRIKALAKQLHFKAPEQKISRPATLEEMDQRMQQSVPPKALPPELKPLEFKTTKVVKGNGPLGKLKGPKQYEAINSAKDITAPQDPHGYGLIDTQAPSADTVKALQNTKDILPNQTLTKTIYELADRLPKQMGNYIKTQLDSAKVNHVNNMEQRTNDLYNTIVKGLGINKGSKESALVQDYGEKTLAKNYLEKRGIDPSKVSEQELNIINNQQLKKIRPNDWQKIVTADNYFKQNYKKMIDEVNNTVKQIYPNNPEKIVPERKDYYHHFNELTGFEGFKNLIQNSSAIDPHLAGISPNTRPNSKWQAFKQMRGNGAYTSDAVGGYLKYLQAASHSTHIDPMIKVLRNTAEQIATATEGTKNLNYLKTALEVHADNLAGKTNPVDRLFQDHIIGRKAMQVLNVVNSHIKKNQILGNLGSALGQIGNVPLTIGKAKQYAPQGLLDTLKFTANHLLDGEKNLPAPINQSQFLKERFSGKMFTRFDNGLLKKPEKMAAWLLETADKSGTYFTWNSMYRKGLAKGVANPIKYADAETRHIIAGRGIGEIPIAQKAKITQLVAPFTLEVGNQWKVLGKQMSEKDFAGVITFLASSYGLNEAMNRMKGSDVSYNPVKAVLDGYNKSTGTPLDKLKGAGANLLGETVGNIPGGNYLPQLLGVTSPKTKQALFGDRAPDRFGTGVGVASTMFKPATDLIGGKGVGQFGKDLLPLIAPLGGNQIKKTVGGIEALSKGGSYDNKGNLQYPVNANNKSDLLHSLMFGPTTTANGQDFYNNNRKPLSTKQTMQYQNAPNKQDYYNNLMYQRKINSIQQKMKDTQKSRTLTPQEKQQNLLILLNELQKIQK